MEQLPFEPIEMWFSVELIAQSCCGALTVFPLPARAYIAATTGAPTLVPPPTIQPVGDPGGAIEVYIATPVRGSPSTATSATVRFRQPVSCCHDGLLMYWLQPLPVPDHTPSLQVRGLSSGIRLVPATATTFGTEAGNVGP